MKRWYWIMMLVGLFFINGLPLLAQTNLQQQTWNAEYFNNPYLAGTPSFTRQDGGIGFDWGMESPGRGIPADNFSVRWGKGGYLPGG
ncbi:MAG: hypothetical protein KC496_08255, partial [Anaerolineae bacterium]|nr:hypothetical protein [Anaerolineae bacterium]